MEGKNSLRLVYRLSALGDVALMGGVLDYWHRAHGWRFIVATAAHLAPLFELHPAVDEVVPLDKSALRGTALFGSFRKLAARYSGLGLIDLHGSLRSHVLRMFWKGPVAAYPKFSIERRRFLKSRSPEAGRRLTAMNVTQRYAMAVESDQPPAAALRPKVYLSADELEWGRLTVAGIYRQLPGAARPDFPCPVILHPYATHSRKMWPLDHWISLVEALERAGIFWLVAGQDEPLFPGDPRDLTNKTSLRELCAVLSQGCLMVTGDSGPMHLAAAVDLPVLALFGPTTREWGFFPAGERDRVLELGLPCRPCSLHGGKECPNNGECLRGIGVEDVLNAVLERYAG